MNNIQALFEVWLYCQTKLEKTLRWSKYIECEKNEELVNCNSIRKQNVAQHTLSKLLVFSMILPDLKKIFSDLVNFELLFSCIVYHDFGEGLRDQKYDILSTDKKNSHDVEEWRLIC